MTAGELIAIGISVASAAMAAVALKYTRDSARAAVRQAAAAEAALPEPTPAVAWQPSRLGDGYFALRNVGTGTATNVTVAAAGYGLGEIQVTPAGGQVVSGATIRVFLAGGAESPDVDELRLTWGGQPTPVVVPLPPVA